MTRPVRSHPAIPSPTYLYHQRNLINHPNLAAPDGNLSSSLFGQSMAVSGGQAGGIRASIFKYASISDAAHISIDK